MRTQNLTRIEAVPDLPVIRIIREFEAPAERVFRAYVDPDLFAQWCGPRSIETRIDVWDARTGGEWRYTASRAADDFEMGFWGSFHEIRPGERIVQTWSFDGEPDGVSLETVVFEVLEGGRCRVVGTSVVESIEIRDQMLRSGMDTGVREGYERLDELLEGGAVTTPAEHHREVAGDFTRRVDGTTDWDAPAPVDGWLARDVVRHLVEWFPSFLESGTGIRLAALPSVDDDPVAAWHAHAAAVQDLLDDPAYADHVLTNPHIGDVPLPEAVDRFYTGDVFLHTWDLARATGQDETLDPETCAGMLAGMEPMDELLRSSGQYGARVPVPDDADVQTRLIAFIGRDPDWRP